MNEEEMLALTSERKMAGTVSPHNPRVIRVLPITDYGGTTRYYMNDFPLPVPAWTRRLNGRSVSSVMVALGLALLALAWAGWTLWRLLFG